MENIVEEEKEVQEEEVESALIKNSMKNIHLKDVKFVKESHTENDCWSKWKKNSALIIKKFKHLQKDCRFKKIQ